MTTETKLPFDKEYVSSFSKEMSEPAWFAEFRMKALEQFDELPMPKPDKTKIDKWNFTQFQQHTVKSAPYSSLAELPEAVKALVETDAKNQTLYIQRNQTPAFLSVSEDLKAKGVIFTDLFTAVREHGDLLKKYYMTQAINADEHRLTALHAALVNGGAFLYVPKNVEITEPIQAVFVHDDPQANLFNHVLVVAEGNSAVPYVENYISTLEESATVANIITEVMPFTM